MSKVHQNEQIILQIATPSGVFTGTFAKTTKVKEVISMVIQQQGLSSGDSFELVLNGSVLTPDERPLVSFDLSGTVELELVATGSGV
jgi:hypothetical protein